jgi:hypothetical protein
MDDIKYRWGGIHKFLVGESKLFLLLDFSYLAGLNSSRSALTIVRHKT